MSVIFISNSLRWLWAGGATTDGADFCRSSSFCSSATTAGLSDAAFLADFMCCWRLFNACNKSSLLRNGRTVNFNGCFFGAGVVVMTSSWPANRINPVNVCVWSTNSTFQITIFISGGCVVLLAILVSPIIGLFVNRCGSGCCGRCRRRCTSAQTSAANRTSG